jgi:hypothetical protein
MSSLRDRSGAKRAPTPDTHIKLAYRRLGLRWRGQLDIPRGAHPLVRRLFEEANRQQTTLTEIAERAGLRRGTIGQWGRKNNPRVHDLEAALNVLGYGLVVRPMRDDD